MSDALKPWNYQKDWLESDAYDGMLIFGVLFLALFSGAIVYFNPALFPIVFALDIWFLGYHHVISTFTKLVGTKDDRQENAFLIYVLPFLVLMGVGGLYAIGGGIWPVVTVYLYWQWYHYTRQSYGIAVFYSRKSSVPKLRHPKLEFWALWSVPIWGILNRSAEGWDKFLLLDVYTVPVPEYFVTIAGIISIALVGAWVLSKFQDWREGSISLGHTYYMISHFMAFYIGYILIDDINTGFIVANVWHNAQYILFVWLYQTKRFAAPIKEGEVKPWLNWFSQKQPLRILAYFTACMGLTTLVYKTLEVSIFNLTAGDAALIVAVNVVLYQTINFHHYIVDSYIWKARKKKNQKVMGVSASPNTNG